MQFPEHLWFKSSRTVEHNQCVEVALTSEQVGVRDTKDRAGGHFTVTAAQWSAFVDRVKAGDRDLPA